MNVRYMVELTDEERAQLQELTGSGNARVRRVKRGRFCWLRNRDILTR